MDEHNKCPQCGAELPADAPAGQCPQCLLKAGLPTGLDIEGDSPVSDRDATLDSRTPPGGFVPPPPRALAGEFAQLEIIELLGQGGMGAVYKARQKQLGRFVALKILPPETGRTEAFTERFAREARSLAMLNHPNIVTVHDFGRTKSGLFYFIMEFVEGTDLRRVIESGQLSPAQALAIVPQVCDALQYAHEEGVVHRDIKPENILLDAKGRVKIADFGLARLLDRPGVARTLTHPGMRMGTPHYMAPEQIERPHEVDHRADIYSLGVVFYEMLTGELPLGRFDPPSHRVQVDVRLDEVVLHSLEKEPQRRYQRVSEVKTDVENIRDRPAPSGVAPASTPQAEKTSLAGAALAKHVQLVGIFRIVWGLAAVPGLAFLTAMFIAPLTLARSGKVVGVGVLVFVPILGLILAMMTANIIAGIGLLKGRRWARTMGIVLGALDLPAFPIGTALGIYTIYILVKVNPQELSGAAAHEKADEDTVDTARRRLRIPAVGLVVAAALDCSVCLVALIGAILAAGGAGFMGIVFLGFLLGASLLIVAAATAMFSVQSFGIAVAGSIAALLLPPGCLIGIPMGIWALVVLASGNTHAAFTENSRRALVSGRRNRAPVVLMGFGLSVIALSVVAPLALLSFLMPVRRFQTPEAIRRTATAVRVPRYPAGRDEPIPPPEQVAGMDFPHGSVEYLTYSPTGPGLTQSGADAMNLADAEWEDVDKILQDACREYSTLERQHIGSVQALGQGVVVTIDPFREEAERFLEDLWAKLDGALDEQSRRFARTHLPLARLFGTFKFGEPRVTVSIHREGDRFRYEVRYDSPPGGGRSGIVTELPPEFRRFWNADFGGR